MKFSERLAVDLRMLGVKEGDVLLVHTSLKGLRAPGITPDDVIEALLGTITSEGTLLIPALSYQSVTKEHPYFSVRETPSCIGAVPERFRTRYAQYRSVHPTHSVCASGKLAYALTAWHKLDETPVGEHSPFMQLPLLGGKILMLGCGLRPNTFMHGVEEHAHAPYPLASRMQEYTITDADGSSYSQSYFPHDFGQIEQRYDRLADMLSAPELVGGNALGGTAWLIDAKAALRAASARIHEEPYFFVDVPDGGK